MNIPGLGSFSARNQRTFHVSAALRFGFNWADHWYPMDDAIERRIDALRERLSETLPGARAQERMAPVDRHALPPDLDDRAYREAAVLIPLFPREGELRVGFIVRADDLPHHAGQVSFPGGRRETNETSRQTALREAGEEVGIKPDKVEVLGELTPLYIPPSEFFVYPFVGFLLHPPIWEPETSEVVRVVELPLSGLLDSSNRQTETWELAGKTREVPLFRIDNTVIWGATAMILSELLALLEHPENRTQ